MPRRERKEIILENITVESVAAEGKAIAHSPEGIVIFIEYGVPGDVLDVRVLRQKKNFIDAAYTEHKLSKVERSLDRDALRIKFLQIYGNPVVNKESIIGGKVQVD